MTRASVSGPRGFIVTSACWCQIIQFPGRFGYPGEVFVKFSQITNQKSLEGSYTHHYTNTTNQKSLKISFKTSGSVRLCLAPRTEVQPDLEVAFQLLEETLTIPDHCPPLSCEVSRACLVLKFSPDYLGHLPCGYLLFSSGSPCEPQTWL